ncbi:sure-like protein [Xylariaceae sp. FL1019]|nr:sure-like protein [Xylariaceae sp. FL1019]
MRTSILASTLTIAGVHGARILQSNDDGWAESYIRKLNDALTEAGHDVLLSAPAQNESGTGSLDVDPLPSIVSCEYDSCDAGGAVGSNSTNPRLNWVNSFPVTSARYGVENFAPQFWGDSPAELVVSGPNVGSNLYLAVPFSGTVGVARYAAHDVGIPAIAFSGATEDRQSYAAAPASAASAIYAELSTQLTEAILASGTPYLPDDTFLNVNFPTVDNCPDAASYSWVLTRINPAGILSTPDVETCGNTVLPTETDVVGGDGCVISVSVGDASDKTTAAAEQQQVVLDKLGSMITCWSG